MKYIAALFFTSCVLLATSRCVTVNAKYVDGCYDGRILLDDRCKYYDEKCNLEIRQACEKMEENWLPSRSSRKGEF